MTCICIDLKSFYASVECVERKLDPLNTNLVVADPTRTEKTICLAVSPSLKAWGVPGRPRLFEVVEKVREMNSKRLSDAKKHGFENFVSSSFIDSDLNNDPSLELAYYVAPPRMKLYEEYSTKIYSIYLKYVAPEDIHVYSIDEVFIDVTHYLSTYKMTAHELAMTMIRDVLYSTGITATVGIGSNLYLAKIAMDIVAKRVPADKDGVRIAEIDEMSYRQLLWTHRPLTDFWRIGKGYSARLEKMGLYTMGDIARASLTMEDALYKAFGINAELLIDHAWGWEPVEIKDIKDYKPSAKSISSGQVLKEPYSFEKGRLIVKEMAELLALDLVKKNLSTKQLVLTVCYEGLKNGSKYDGPINIDHYGKITPKHAHGTANLGNYTSSTKKIVKAFSDLYGSIVDPKLFIRRVNIAACGLDHSEPDDPVQMSLFSDEDDLPDDERERSLQETILSIQDKYGRNAVLKGMNFSEGATSIERNGQIGGHKAV